MVDPAGKKVAEAIQSTDEEPAPRPMRDVRIPKASLGKTTKPDHKVKLKPLEAMAALDTMSKTEKKGLRYLLQAEEEEEDDLQCAATSSTAPTLHPGRIQ